MLDDIKQDCDRSCETLLLIGPGILSGFFILNLFCVVCFIWYDIRQRVYEHSILARWKLPIPGLHLCQLCKDLKRGSGDIRIQHYDNFQSLENSAQRECWCCRKVSDQFARSTEDHDIPFARSDPSDLEVYLKIPHILLWFAEHTSTKTGYLDHLRQIGMQFIKPSVMIFINVIKDYCEYIFKPRLRHCETQPSSQARFCLIGDWFKNLQSSASMLPGYRSQTSD
jgi:hypothetical protein